LNSQKIFKGENGELSVAGRLAAGAFAGMTSTFVSNSRTHACMVSLVCVVLIF